ncbi:MAG: hypothetical protein VZR54_07120 [Ruminococcus sp.]|nr:hypothetical protein [Ruminococcus sp.]
MTKAGAIAKAKRYAKKMNDMTVIFNGIYYEVIHTDYLEEYEEDGWKKIASYRYNDKCEVEKY